MILSKEVNQKIQARVINGVKTPHSSSYPVIVQDNDEYLLAVFTFFFSKDDIEAGTVSRPTLWTTADIESGEIKAEYQAKDNDFSDASYNVKYDIHSNKEYDTSKEYYEKAFEILDSVRKKILAEGVLDKTEYAKYMDMILANIPEEYKRFYIDLSVDYLDMNDDDKVNDKGDDIVVNDAEQLKEIVDAIQKLQKCFDDKIAQDEHKNSLFDNMHRELTKYQNGAMDKKIDSMAMDVIMLRDNVKRVIKRNENVEMTEDAFRKLIGQLKGISEELEDILYRESIESYIVVGDDVDVKKQKIIGTVDTDDESLHNKVAERGVEGFEKEDRVLRKENVKIYKYVEGTDDNESGETSSKEQ